jgi:Tol biopolymer transport system component
MRDRMRYAQLVVVALILSVAAITAIAAQNAAAPAPNPTPASSVPLLAPGEEKFLANVRQLTFGGQNAEAYWSADGKKLIFQSDGGDLPCDQIFTMNADGSDRRRVSNGQGKTTCSYFFPSGDRILYGSTFRASPDCPPKPDRSRGYVWALDDYDIYTARPDGSDIRPLFSSPAYDAEATISPDGKTIVFTSARDGDLEIYTMNADGSNVKRLTHTPGYDGGPFFSDDGKKIVYRADHPEKPEDLAKYRENLARGTYAPRALEIRVMNADGSGDHAVTSNGKANFAPYFLPGNKEIIFSSNLADPNGRDFDLYLIREDGTGLTRVTYSPDFDGFPMFTRDGKTLVFASNRNGQKPHETNIFVADWVRK